MKIKKQSLFKEIFLLTTLLTAIPSSAFAERVLLAANSPTPSPLYHCLSPDGVMATFGIWQDTGAASFSLDGGPFFNLTAQTCPANFAADSDVCFFTETERFVVSRDTIQAFRNSRPRGAVSFVLADTVPVIFDCR